MADRRERAQLKVKPVVAVYIDNYLSVSQTFVYRQLHGVRDAFDPIVLAAKRRRTDLFPYEPLYVQRMSAFDRVGSHLWQFLTRTYTAASPAQRKRWIEIAKAHQVKLIHAHFGPGGLRVLPVARKLNIPLLVTFHGYDISRLLCNRRYTSSLDELFEYATMIAVSEAVANRLASLGADPARVHVHYIGVPVDDFDFVPREPLVQKVRHAQPIEFLQVANFVEKKGHEYTVRAFRELLASYKQARLCLAGDGPLRPRIEQMCVDLGIRPQVQFIGAVDTSQVAELMRKADVFLHHSVTADDGDQEGLPTVILEAMATGLPVVSSRHSGIPEAITDGENGYLVGERNIPEYVTKLHAILSSDTDVSRKARTSIESRFNIDNQNVALADIYRARIQMRKDVCQD